MEKSLFEELDFWLQGEDNDGWYDDGSNFAEDVLNQFQQTDWDKLLSELSEKDDMWHKKLAYSLTNNYDGDHNNNALNALLILLDTENEEVIITALDSLRDFQTSNDIISIQSNKNIYNQFKKLESTTSKPVQWMLEAFKKQFYTD